MIAVTPARLGTDYRIRVDNLPSNSVFMTMGYSNTDSQAGPLPIDLTANGMPGCKSYTSADATLFLQPAAGNSFVDYTLSIPTTPSFVGLRFFHQAFVSDPAANAGGAIVSNGLEAVVGN